MKTLLQAIEEHHSRQALAQVKAKGVRAWNAGSCVRALWYGEHGFDPLPNDAGSAMRLDLGRRIEDAVCYYADLASKIPGAPRFRRATVDDTHDMMGRGNVRPDGYVQGDPYGFPDETLWVDVKSMSEYPFDRATTEGVDYYLKAQFEVYCHVPPGYPAGVVVCYHKDTSRMFELVYRSDSEVWRRCLVDLETAKGSIMPGRPDVVCSCGGTGKTKHKQPRIHEACSGTGYALKGGELPKGLSFIPNFPCGTCSYRLDCWGALEEVRYKDAWGEDKTRLRPCGDGRF